MAIKGFFHAGQGAEIRVVDSSQKPGVDSTFDRRTLRSTCRFIGPAGDEGCRCRRRESAKLPQVLCGQVESEFRGAGGESSVPACLGIDQQSVAIENKRAGG